MKRIFLGGRMDSTNVSHWMGSIYDNKKIENKFKSQGMDFEHKKMSNDSNYTYFGKQDEDTQFIEVWDYVGGTSFRGFVADKELSRGRIEKTMFLFFEHVAGTQLKHGLMALIELATECFACDRLVICLERTGEGLPGLIRDLGWVGFELVTLAHWMQTEIPGGPRSARCSSFSSVSTSSSVFSDDEITSEKWLFMGMEL